MLGVCLGAGRAGWGARIWRLRIMVEALVRLRNTWEISLASGGDALER